MSRFLRWQVGGVRITRVVELTTASIGTHIIPSATPENLKQIAWISPFVDEAYKPVLSMHSLIVESEGQTIVVDTCIGNDKDRNYPRWHHMQSNFLADLGEAGFSTEAVDQVICTHLHVDHVGWNTTLINDRWVPTFQRANYLFGRVEYEHWSEEPQEYGPVFKDSVAPVWDAGKAQLIENNHQLTSEVSLIPTPGHTPGHVSVKVESKGETAIITGDLMHHPCQITHSHWQCTADFDDNQAAATRTQFIARYADQPVLIIGTHFSGPTAGWIVRDGSTFRLDY